MNLKLLFQTNTVYIPLFSGTVQADKFYYSCGRRRVDKQLLKKPFKLLTASARNDNALEDHTIVGTYSLL